MNVEEIKQRYKDEWVLGEVKRSDELDRPIDVDNQPVIVLDVVIKGKILGKTVNNIKAIVHDLPPKSYVDGLLGLSFLRNFNLALNFKEGYLELE